MFFLLLPIFKNNLLSTVVKTILNKLFFPSFKAYRQKQKRGADHLPLFLHF